MHLDHRESKHDEEGQKEKQSSNKKRKSIDANDLSSRSAQRNPFYVFWLRGWTNFRLNYFTILACKFEVISRLKAGSVEE